jgi:hypothetical protein
MIDFSFHFFFAYNKLLLWTLHKFYFYKSNKLISHYFHILFSRVIERNFGREEGE